MGELGNADFGELTKGLQRVAARTNLAPASIIGAVLTLWFKHSFPALPSEPKSVPLALKGDPNIDEFVSMLLGQPLLDATYWMSSAYAQLIGHERRKSLSMFFTPPPLTARLLDDLQNQQVRFDRGVFLDPACGGSAFLIPVAQRMKCALKSAGKSAAEIVRHVESNLIGIDIDPVLCMLSRQFLRAALAEEISASDIEPKFGITCGNALQDPALIDGKADVLLCNPPYRKMTSYEVGESTEFRHLFKSQPNIYGLFLARGVRLVKAGGICAFVTPTSFLSGHSFSNVRRFLIAEAQMVSVGIVSDRSGIFIDVQQETALTIFRRRNGEPGVVHEASVSLVSRDGQYTSVGACYLPNSGAAWPIPRHESDVRLLEKSLLLPHRLSDYGYVIRIGNFVWNRDVRPKYKSSRTASRWTKSRTLVPLLWSSDIQSGKSIRFDGGKKKNGEWCFVDLGDRNHRSVIRRPSVLLQRVTSNDQAQRLVAASVPASLFKKYGGFVGENHTVIVEQCVARPALSPRNLARLLGARAVDRYFRCISGATNVSIFELEQLPLPDPKWVRKMIKSGVSIEAAAAMAMYGASADQIGSWSSA